MSMGEMAIMENETEQPRRFPGGLLEWAGHHSGGVKRLFDPSSGRPGKELLRTSLISRLEAWASLVASGAKGTPRILLLVGGPGNGKTEAIEFTIDCLDKGLAANGSLRRKLSEHFHPLLGQPVPRHIHVDAGALAAVPRRLDLSIVQDASATAGHEGRSAPELLIDELRSLLADQNACYYLCCVNRGVLDDALIHAIDHDLGDARALLERITRSVSLSADAPSCWPLLDYPDIAVWPMDAESLLAKPDSDIPAPAEVLLRHAVDSRYWPAQGTCIAGDRCPFCRSQALLAREDARTSLLKILRWYELASGKRWSFRDLFSLVSYLLAGNLAVDEGKPSDPCSWAASLWEQDQSGQSDKKPRRQQLVAIFQLATAGYQHALFHHWDPLAANVLRQGIKDLGLGPEKATTDTRGPILTLLGLQYFLAGRKDSYLPATIASLLSSLSDLLDPAMASPETEVAVSGRSNIVLAELDARFSRSVAGGIEFVRKYQALSKIEVDLLQRLAKLDETLSLPATRRRNPAAAGRIQNIVRDFACRLVRRSLCTRTAVVADAQTLEAFQHVVEDVQGKQLFEVAKQVKDLLNRNQRFEVSLTTTFGQPLPPQQRQATLLVQTRPVKALQLASEGRPRSPICFLQVGSGQSLQPIALTYDLFKAVKELERGISIASLPRTVVALLDTTRARLAGTIVRDPDVLEESIIRIGSDGIEVGQSWNGFVATVGGKQP